MIKEVHFFDNHERYAQGIEFYARRYKHCYLERNTELIIDGTPNYLTYHNRVYETFRQSPSALAKLKIIIVLREPIEREKRIYYLKKSEYEKSTDKTHGWFMDIIDEDGEVMSIGQYAETILLDHLNKPSVDHASEGKYVDHLQKWTDQFPRHQILILSHDELTKNPKSLQERVEAFLGIKLEGSLGGISDDSGVSPRVTAALKPLFDKKNEELYEFLENNPGPHMEQTPFPRFASAAAQVQRLSDITSSS